jgi:hypothetical protein
MILLSSSGYGPPVFALDEAEVCEAAVGPSFSDSADEVTGTVGRSAAYQSLPLTEEQRGFVFLGIMCLPETPDVEVGAPTPSSALPEAVELHDLPAMITQQIPVLQNHKFVKLFDRILLVRPQDRAIVSEIPRYRLLP